MLKTHKAFTIVELLIVVVVIAILAAITIIGYNGITTRAENAKTVSGVSAVIKGLSMYAQLNGVYTTDAYACIGSTSYVCGNTNSGPVCVAQGRVNSTGSLASDLSSTINKIPDLSSQQITCSTGATYRGGFVSTSNSRKSSTVVYFLKGSSTPCGIIGASRSVDGGLVACQYALPNL